MTTSTWRNWETSFFPAGSYRAKSEWTEVPILPISCNKATLIPSARIAGIVHGWTADQFQPLLAAGIDVDSIEVTYCLSVELFNVPVFFNTPAAVLNCVDMSLTSFRD